MAGVDLTEPPVLGDSRGRVLAALQTAGRPLAVEEVAEKVGLHPNTARFHLDGLLAQGLVTRSREDRAVPGRPRALYTSTPGSARTGRRSYRMLAEILTGYLASRSRRPSAEAREAGRAWGRMLGPRRRESRVAPGTAVRGLVTVLDEIGFAPEPVGSGTDRRILLHHCPFREAAEQQQEIVCAIHLGLMQGVLEEMGAPVAATGLDPFVEPDLCIAHLRTAPPA